MSEKVRYAYRDGVAEISLDDGKVNVMSKSMLDEIGAALDRAEKDQAIVVLRSARPGLFSAGFDLKVFASNDAGKSLEMVRAGGELALRLLSFPHPTIGVLQGHAFPMGTFLLLGCDARIGARGAHKMGLNEVAIGIVPPGFAIELARSRMHPAWLNRTVALGEMFEPDEAQAAGLLDIVVEKEALEQTVSGVAAGLGALHRASHTAAKRALRQSAMTAIRTAIDRELTLDAYAAQAQSAPTVSLPGG